MFQTVLFEECKNYHVTANSRIYTSRMAPIASKENLVWKADIHAPSVTTPVWKQQKDGTSHSHLKEINEKISDSQYDDWKTGDRI